MQQKCLTRDRSYFSCHTVLYHLSDSFGRRKICKCTYFQGDGDCVGPGHAGHVALCCYNGCGANACLAASHVVPRSVVATTTDTCPVVETKTEQQCANATANCWSRGESSVINAIITQESGS